MLKFTRQRSGESGVASRHKVIKSLGLGPRLWQFRVRLSCGARGLASRSLWSEQVLKDCCIWQVQTLTRGTFLQVSLLLNNEVLFHQALGLVRKPNRFAELQYTADHLARFVLPTPLYQVLAMLVAYCSAPEFSCV